VAIRRAHKENGGKTGYRIVGIQRTSSGIEYALAHPAMAMLQKVPEVALDKRYKSRLSIVERQQQWVLVEQLAKTWGRYFAQQRTLLTKGDYCSLLQELLFHATYTQWKNEVAMLECPDSLRQFLIKRTRALAGFYWLYGALMKSTVPCDNAMAS
jgi:hypothetical protein